MSRLLKIDKDYAEWIHIKTVIFDMDGVIFDTERLYLDCWRKLAVTYGLTEIASVYHRCIGVNAGMTKQIFIDAYGGMADPDAFLAAAKAMFFQYVEENGMPMKPGVRELLDFLTDSGYRLGLASSTAGHLVRTQLAGRDLLAYFKVVVSGDMVTRSKPAPDIFLKACAEIGALPSEAFAIEDSYHGIRAAAAAGMKALMVPDIVLPDDEMKRLAERVFSSLTEVLDFFRILSGLF